MNNFPPKQDVALSHGLSNKESAVEYFKTLVKDGAGVVVAWGEKGASCYHPDSGIISCPSYPPSGLYCHYSIENFRETIVGGVVDSLGAGDTFNAAVIGGLASGLGLAESVDLGCQVAGEKVGFRGFAGLTGKARDIVQKKSFIKS